MPAYKDPNSKPETGLRLWQRENKEMLLAAARKTVMEARGVDAGEISSQALMGPYSQTSAKIWGELDEEVRERYQLLAKRLNEGTATPEEKRK